MAITLSPELVEVVEGGASMAVGSRDDAHRPECARGLGAAWSEADRRVSLYLYAPLAARMRHNFESNGFVAVTFGRIVDMLSIQLKGVVRALRDATPADEAMARRYLIAFAEQLSITGAPRSVVRRIRISPGLVVEIEPTDIFHQTPGPNAGRRLAAPS